MRTSLPSSFAKLILICCFAILAISASAQVTGAAFTTEPVSPAGCNPSNCVPNLTNPDGFLVNANTQYPDKTDVFFNGGPRNDNGAGLTPTGTYYFQVTDPSGKVLLSADPAACRVVDVVADGSGHGRVTGLDSGIPGTCPSRLQFADSLHKGEPVQLCPPASSRADTLGNGAPLFDTNNWCDNTPNNGGVYKAFLIRTDHASVVDSGGNPTSDASSPYLSFSDRDSQTDNFKIKQQGSVCTTDCPGPPPASVSVCKFWDKNADHLEDNGEPLLPGWTIDITNQDGGGTAGSAITGSGISDFGCVMFSIGFAGGPTTTVSLNEVLQNNWNQTAPQDGTYSVSDGMAGSVDVTVSGFVQTLTVAPGDAIQLNDFGNTGLDLTVSKTASPAFTRTYNWSISKDVDKTLIETTGSTATFNYTVVASETGFTDSGWQVTGTITVTNPNGFDVVTSITDDDSADGGTCAVTNGTGVTVPANSTASRNYTCTYSSNPSSGTNTATATWDASVYNTPDGSASGQAGFTFGAPTGTVNQTITVTDTYWTNLPSPTIVTLGTCGVATAPCTFTYSRTITVKAGCFFYDNTATIKETGLTASKEVEVCGPAKTGALTMGFWQNKNGQGIISATNQANLGTWLKGYHPFSDAPSSGLATYVYNIIKLATCSGPASSPCNAMLRAQMLATALDVYFSDPALGGNKIGAPGPIGAVSIDLTKVCNMIDGSGGTATCSGTFSNVASLFGVAKCATVSAMLAYQNITDPLADKGAVWYGNNKTNQVGAKNAFDAINNQVAFPCP